MDAGEIEIQKQFNERCEESVYRALARERGNMLVQLVANAELESILDIGARHGDTLIHIHDMAPMLRLTGVDIVPSFLDEIRESGIEAVEADAADLPFPDQSFDLVFCSHTLEHCLDSQKAMEECFRVAKNAVLLVVPIEDQKHFDENPSHHFHAKHPADWWEMYIKADSKRAFLPTLCRLTQYADVEMLFMRVPE